MKLELRSLRVKECGPLRDVCIDFCDASGKPRPITVLAGANGSGKTTVLELIVTLLEFLDKNSRMFFTGAVGHVLSVGGISEAALSETILSRTSYVEIDLLLDEKDEKNAGLRFNNQQPHLFEQQQGIGQLEELIRSSHQRIIDFHDMNTSAVVYPALAPSILYFPHSRQLTPLRGTQVQKEETKYEWIHRYENVREFAGSLDSYLIWLDYAEPETFARAIEFLNSLDFDGKTFGVSRKDLKSTVTTRDGRTHGISDLSSGEQNILIMLLELRRRLLPYSIVLIDEIENSLHPAFQYRLAQALKRMQESIPFQLIVTTHAQAFVDIFGLDSTLILTEF